MACPYGFDDKEVTPMPTHHFPTLLLERDSKGSNDSNAGEEKCPYGFDKLPGAAEQWAQLKAERAKKRKKRSECHRSKVNDIENPQEFINFLTKAMTDRTGPEMREFYIYLQECFTNADLDLDGMIGPREFDALVEETVAIPRIFGYAPTTEQLYMSEVERLAARSELFRSVDVTGRGLISFPEFLKWATEHTHSKVSRGAQPWKAGVSMLSLIQPSSPQDFARFLQKATQSKNSPEYKDLYFHLLRCFTDADTTMSGVINADGFENLIEIAAMAPRKFGFAPSSAGMFKGDKERKASRKALFRKIDTDGSGTISFDKFLDWAFEHIKGKVRGGVHAIYIPHEEVPEDAALEARNLPIYDDASSPADFAAFCKAAITDSSSPEYQKLYYHLLRCFTFADAKHSGRITARDFDRLVDIAAAAPRKFGFAPHASDMFVSVDERRVAREILFKAIDEQGRGEICFQEFLKWALGHIRSKVIKGIAPYKAGVGKLSLIKTSCADDLVKFLGHAVASRKSAEYRDLYFHLLRCFTDADSSKTGVIDADGFDRLVDITAMEPRKYGFAPSATSAFKSESERKASRMALFKTIDRDGSGTISFDEFLQWAVEHIGEKVQGGVHAAYQPTAIKVDPSFYQAKNLPIYSDASTPEQFAAFCKAATSGDRNSADYKKLYYHLLRCFSDADAGLTGRVTVEEFDSLVDVAAAAPRRFGFAPSTAEMFLSVEERKVSRAALFKTIDRDGSGEISFHDFLRWAVEHIKSKTSRGAVPWKAGVGRLSLIQTASPQDFTEFLKAATASKSSPEYKDLYFHLLRCFTDADVTMSGVIDASGFDRLIEIAAMAPRKYGFAPSAARMFRNEAERKASRANLFKLIDEDGGGTISFDEFLAWAVAHIKDKVREGVRAAFEPSQEAAEDSSLEARNLPIYDDASSPSDFADFCKRAVAARTSPEYQKLYYHLLRCFTDADAGLAGRIDAAGFDSLIDVAAAAPRRFGFAPDASEMFANAEERKRARAELFRTINADGSGAISFQEFLAWALRHIEGKVSQGVHSWEARKSAERLVRQERARQQGTLGRLLGRCCGGMCSPRRRTSTY